MVSTVSLLVLKRLANWVPFLKDYFVSLCPRSDLSLPQPRAGGAPRGEVTAGKKPGGPGELSLVAWPQCCHVEESSCLPCYCHFPAVLFLNLGERVVRILGDPDIDFSWGSHCFHRQGVGLYVTGHKEPHRSPCPRWGLGKVSAWHGQRPPAHHPDPSLPSPWVQWFGGQLIVLCWLGSPPQSTPSQGSLCLLPFAAELAPSCCPALLLWYFLKVQLWSFCILVFVSTLGAHCWGRPCSTWPDLLAELALHPLSSPPFCSALRQLLHCPDVPALEALPALTSPQGMFFGVWKGLVFGCKTCGTGEPLRLQQCSWVDSTFPLLISISCPVCCLFLFGAWALPWPSHQVQRSPSVSHHSSEFCRAGSLLSSGFFPLASRILLFACFLFKFLVISSSCFQWFFAACSCGQLCCENPLLLSSRWRPTSGEAARWTVSVSLRHVWRGSMVLGIVLVAKPWCLTSLWWFHFDAPLECCFQSHCGSSVLPFLHPSPPDWFPDRTSVRASPENPQWAAGLCGC